MARAAKKKPVGKKKAPKKKRIKLHPIEWVRLWIKRVFLAILAFFALGIVGYAFINPPTTPHIIAEKLRLGWADHQWVDLEDVAPVMARSVVAAEDANFCQHWGFDMRAIRAAIDEGGARGASTLTQQVVKNAYLWHGRSWPRKALEAGITPFVELFWSKRRIVEVYLNIAEFDEGVFGVEAASRHYFGVGPENLTAVQAARLAALLPNPKERSAARPSPFVRKRAQSILDGAATIRADGRASCFED
ncbi:monofunctional biosynthetic peptidoglycan transglycosylase [Aliiroseovarius sp. M344]|uniref:monofunctional biosynthetic peptidoglycan transglycosylase n=1 Tax=Aliiroseovarius sp. M344 TaxID=2867010 RepID=UPI00220941B2|nr:monofunctional biosynthetic peptidoglycan transglycosylase [Aliiroseovarius sp. M344]UWQ14184.1 monofunctional biosynthetic peptidoglycan transglycosylase [Aliiroseovarius sp. M344]